MADQQRKQITQIELEMMVDQIAKAVPASVQLQIHHARILKARYDALLEVGFTAEQALEIVKARPVIE